MSYLQKHSKQFLTCKVPNRVQRFTVSPKLFIFILQFSYDCICLVRNWGKREGKKGFWILGKNEKFEGTTIKICKNLNRRRLRPSQFRKLYQSSSREGVEEEEGGGGGGGGRWEYSLTTLLPCDLKNLLRSLLFVFPFSLIFFPFFFLPLISRSGTKFLPFWLICHSSKNPPTKFSKQKPMAV